MRSLTTTSVSIPDFDPRMATGQGASKMAVHYFTPNNPALVPTHRVAVYQNPDITTVVDDSTNLHTKTTEHAADRYPRTEFYKKFQGEIEEHDQDFEKRYGGDLDTTLIFVSVCSLAGHEVNCKKYLERDTYYVVSRSPVYSRL